jgi:hypothetical protein
MIDSDKMTSAMEKDVIIAKKDIIIAAILISLAREEVRCPKRLDELLRMKRHRILQMRNELEKARVQLLKMQNKSDYWRSRAFKAKDRLPSSDCSSIDSNNELDV